MVVVVILVTASLFLVVAHFVFVFIIQGNQCSIVLGIFR
jgi:hypothetical protein